jgi:hypothetical protein
MSEERPDEMTAPPLSGIAPLAQAIGTRNLLIIVVTMPLVFLIVVMATLSIFGSPDKRERVAAASKGSEMATLEQPAPGRVTLPIAASTGAAAPLLIPQGAALGALALDGDRLAVRIDTPDGGAIVVYDLVRGVEIQRIEVRESGRGDL